jgi:hypothetical protein
VPPHIHIPGITTPPQRTQPTNQDKREQLTAATFLKQGCAPFVWITTGSGGVQPSGDRTFLTKLGKPAKKMTGDEYAASCTAALRHFFPGLHHVDLANVYLVHDRAKFHPKKTVDVGVFGSLKAIHAPPRSPDLMPLDYCVFGTVKNTMTRGGWRSRPWPERAQKFVELLQTFDATNSLKSFKGRLKACIKEKGGHFAER